MVTLVVLTALVVGFIGGGLIVWFCGDTAAYQKGFEAGSQYAFQHSLEHFGDVIVRVRKEVLK